MMTADYTNLPDFVERKGSLFLRSDHMNYSRATLNSNWHQAREAEPKEYDISKDPYRDLLKATYRRIGNVVTDGSLPETTYKDFSEQIYDMKRDFTEQDWKKPMVNESTYGHLQLDREGAPEKGHGSVLPRHHPEYNQCQFDTTHRSDYKPPYAYVPAEEKPVDFPDHSIAYKKCHSQFTDSDDYRRWGRNTWMDETGIYANSHLKAQAPAFRRTNPLTRV